jgi:tetratricopeptide (TPR) repeat protein
MVNHPSAARRRLLLVGWDAADWIVIDQLLEAGRMPNLARLVGSGTMGNLASLSPCLSPMLWTSAATGQTADRHGILGFVQPRPDGLGLLPSQSSSRRCKALWNILGEAGLRPGVVAWPVSDPPEPIPGVCVSERLTEGLADRPEAIGPAPAGCVHPPSLLPFVSELRLHPCELAPEDLCGMIPDIARIDLGADHRPEHLARLYARCVTVHAVATAAMAAEPWDFFAVYYDAIDRAGHDFMAYRAPRLPWVSADDQRLYGEVMDGLYAFHDAMLGRLLALAGEDATVILMSDHGFQSGARRPAAQGPLGRVAAEGADWHRHLGVFAIKGPGIKPDERIYGATLLDIAPTVLALFGLPVGRDMPGRVLTGAFEVPPEVRQVDTWEDGESVVGPSPAATEGPADPRAREASLRQLVALGYLAEDALDGAAAVRMAEREAQFNLGSVHLHHGRPAAALPLFEDLCRQAPLPPRYEIARLHALSRLSRHPEVLAGIGWLEAAGLADAALDLLAAAALAALAAQGRDGEVLERYAAAARRDAANPLVHRLAGDYHLIRERLDAAAASYAAAIERDPEDSLAYSGLAQVALARGDWAAAAEHALASLRQHFHNPVAQFRLGRALAELGARAPARRAFEHAIAQAPGYGEAHWQLANLLEAEGDPCGAGEHRQRAMGLTPAGA